MKQVEFSNIVKEYLIEKYPIFLKTLVNQPDGSFDCSLKNSTKEFSCWIATYNSEITIGLEDPDQISGCHTHMSFYGQEPSEQLNGLNEYLTNIFSNKLIFYQSSLSGFSWTDNPSNTFIEKRKDENIKFFSWDGKVYL